MTTKENRNSHKSYLLFSDKELER